jgi:hypothetical protein
MSRTPLRPERNAAKTLENNWGKAAFEIKKDPRWVMTLSEADVEKYLDPIGLLNGLEHGFGELELGEVQSPPRLTLSVAGKGFCLAMPAWRPGTQLTVKIVSVFDGNLDKGTRAETRTARRWRDYCV